MIRVISRMYWRDWGMRSNRSCRCSGLAARDRGVPRRRRIRISPLGWRPCMLISSNPLRHLPAAGMSQRRRSSRYPARHRGKRLINNRDGRLRRAGMVITAAEVGGGRNRGTAVEVEGGGNSARIGWTRIISGGRSRVGSGRRGSVRRGRIALLSMSRCGVTGNGGGDRGGGLYSVAFGVGKGMGRGYITCTFVTIRDDMGDGCCEGGRMKGIVCIIGDEGEWKE